MSVVLDLDITLANQKAAKLYRLARWPHFPHRLKHGPVLGCSGGVVNALDFCPASLKSFGCFYFRCVLSSQWKAVTLNLRILHCQL